MLFYCIYLYEIDVRKCWGKCLTNNMTVIFICLFQSVVYR